jgi:hypothetical protein
MSEPVRCADELPPLPKHTGCIAVDSTGSYILTPVYTVNQMREYAAQAVAERDAEIGRLRGEVEALRADAERYRWLRDKGDTSWMPMAARVPEGAPGIDAAIDRAKGQE